MNRAPIATVRLLIRHGADVNASVEGISPRLIAHARAQGEVEELLTSAGGTYNPLMLAKLKLQSWMLGSAD
jgi:ankyrin repeat protein